MLPPVREKSPFHKPVTLCCMYKKWLSSVTALVPTGPPYYLYIEGVFKVSGCGIRLTCLSLSKLFTLFCSSVCSVCFTWHPNHICHLGETILLCAQTDIGYHWPVLLRYAICSALSCSGIAVVAFIQSVCNCVCWWDVFVVCVFAMVVPSACQSWSYPYAD